LNHVEVSVEREMEQNMTVSRDLLWRIFKDHQSNQHTILLQRTCSCLLCTKCIL